MLFYTTPNGKVKVEIYLQNETICLTQQKIADLFGVDRTVTTKHFPAVHFFFAACHSERSEESEAEGLKFRRKSFGLRPQILHYVQNDKQFETVYWLPGNHEYYLFELSSAIQRRCAK